MSSAAIIPLDRYNWELCLDIQMEPDQEQFIPSVIYSIAQAKFEDLHPYGILYGSKIVGFLMYGSFGGICWINRIIIDKEYQGQGIGKSAIRELLMLLRGKIACREIRTSYSAENYVADHFFRSLGFHPINEDMSHEIVARYEGLI
ncbi:MAG: GNAT family N-acetyltransferase [Bacteroidia bacterium]|nr:GNAT family N-acetyltransferase [Bacteroidia bacterium]